MMEGVYIGDPIREKMLVSTFYARQGERFLRTLVLAAASTNADNLQDLIQDYRESMFPDGERNEEYANRAGLLLESESKKVYKVSNAEEIKPK